MAVAATLSALALAFLAVAGLMRLRPRWLAAFNRALLNRVTGPFATSLPGFGMLYYVGRRSGRAYHTPVNVFATPEGFVFALTYGRDAGWVKNVLAAGGCRLETRGRVYQLSAPAVVRDSSRRQFPLPVRLVLRLVGASDFIRLSRVAGVDEPSGGAAAGRQADSRPLEA